ncbi:hypothetical protein FQA47_007335 [Oryzias melastigma]|uniref:Uncharacterized protein n=1 Tax=Oryzias melastigma TaxID=30732 RepID=A0A834BRD1_ORYME|nr:hypothetical protein FQA47_007335 [Oryzias melastigma]
MSSFAELAASSWALGCPHPHPSHPASRRSERRCGITGVSLRTARRRSPLLTGERASRRNIVSFTVSLWCQCHICYQAANSNDAAAHRLKETQLDPVQCGECFKDWFSQGYKWE